MSMLTGAVILGVVIGGGIILVGIIRRRNVKSWGRHDTTDEIDIHKKIVVITGASSGIGKATAYELVKRGAVVIIPCRSMERAVATVRDLTKKAGSSNGRMIPMEMDLASLESINAFAKAVKEQFDHINILINNAGVFTVHSKGVTKDGFENNFGINYLSHFLLTELLLEHCIKGATNEDTSRIINVSSTYHEKGEIFLEDLNLRNMNSECSKSVKPYHNSKLAQVYFSQELARRVNMTGVHTYALCPGWVYTNLDRDMDLKWFQYIGMLPFAAMFMRTPNQGCQTVLHCALNKECGFETGKLYRNCKIWRSSAFPLSEAVAIRLWERSAEMVSQTK